MSLLSPKKDNKIKTPIIQTKITKTSPLATTRVDNLGSNKGSTAFLRQSPTSKKSATQKDVAKDKVQNTSIKQLEEKLGGIETKLANIKTQPDKKISPNHKPKEVPKQQIKKNSSEAGKKKVQTAMSPNSIYRKDTIRKTCPNIVKAFETSKMLLNPSQIISPRMTADKIDPLKMNKVKPLGDAYQMIDLSNNSRKSFKTNNLQIKKPDNKKNLKSNEHSAKNLNSVQKHQAKMRVTMSNNLLPKGDLKKSPMKTLFDSSSTSQNKTMQQSSQSLPQLQHPTTMSMIRDKKKIKQHVAVGIIGSIGNHHTECLHKQPKQDLVTSRNRVNSPLVAEYKPIEQTALKINEFQKIKPLGQGKFSKVFLAAHTKSGFLVAIKQISKQKVKKFNMIRQVTDQIKLHSTLNHPNIVKFYALLEDIDNLYLILEYVEGGSLFDYLAQNQKINVKMTLHYLRDIISAIQYLHEKSIAHRDIKPQNILIGMNCIAKVCDLGWSAVILTSRKTYCGTFDYVPPQILQKKDYDLSVDIWCLGVLTYELLVGKVPYEGDKHTIVMNKIHNAQIPYPQQSQQFPSQAKNYIQWLLQHNPQQRPKSKQLLQHKFFDLNKQSVPSIPQ